jgi:hypothetical protein
MTQRYKDYSPTPLDTKGLAAESYNIGEFWVAPVSITRDTESAVTLSNWRVIQRMANDEGIEFEIRRFGHWGPGWFEIILIEGSEKGEKFAEGIENALASYPLLSEDDHSEMEYEHETLEWDRSIAKEFREQLTLAFLGVGNVKAADIVNNLANNQLFTLFHEMGGRVDHDDGGARAANLEDVVDAVGCDDVNKLLVKEKE